MFRMLLTTVRYGRQPQEQFFDALSALIDMIKGVELVCGSSMLSVLLPRLLCNHCRHRLRHASLAVLITAIKIGLHHV